MYIGMYTVGMYVQWHIYSKYVQWHIYSMCVCILVYTVCMYLYSMYTVIYDLNKFIDNIIHFSSFNITK